MIRIKKRPKVPDKLLNEGQAETENKRQCTEYFRVFPCFSVAKSIYAII